MDKRILLGVDVDFSLPTQYALRRAGELFEQVDAGLHFVLLTVVPQPYDPSPALMKLQGMGQIRPPGPTPEQRARAQETLAMACALLRKYRPNPAGQCIELVQRFGEPPAEVAAQARSSGADCIVIGSRGNSPAQNLRRVFAGSVSHSIMRLAPCPVLLVSYPHVPHPPNLVAWYEEAITRYLYEQIGSITILTAEQVTRLFVPPGPSSPAQRKMLAAAAQALQQLARRGKLVCQEIGDEAQYVYE